MDKATSKPLLTKLDIPRLKEQWVEKYSDILGPILLELPPLQEVNHHIPLINEDMRYNFHLPRCPEALETELREKTNRYLSAGWWEIGTITSLLMGDSDPNPWVFDSTNTKPRSIWVSATGSLVTCGSKPMGHRSPMGISY
jgi:hypothetical protein